MSTFVVTVRGDKKPEYYTDLKPGEVFLSIRDCGLIFLIITVAGQDGPYYVCLNNPTMASSATDAFLKQEYRRLRFEEVILREDR